MSGNIKSVDISNCDQLPCQLKQGTNVTVDVDFLSSKNIYIYNGNFSKSTKYNQKKSSGAMQFVNYNVHVGSAFTTSKTWSKIFPMSRGSMYSDLRTCIGTCACRHTLKTNIPPLKWNLQKSTPTYQNWVISINPNQWSKPLCFQPTPE